MWQNFHVLLCMIFNMAKLRIWICYSHKCCGSEIIFFGSIFFAKPSCEFFCLCNKIDNNQWVFRRFHAILVIEDWSLSDPDPANNFGSDRIRIRIRIHNTDSHRNKKSRVLSLYNFLLCLVSFRGYYSTWLMNFPAPKTIRAAVMEFTSCRWDETTTFLSNFP